MNSFSISYFIRLLFQNWNMYKKRYIFFIYLFFFFVLIYLYNQIGDYFTKYYLLFSLVSIFFFIDNFFLSNLASRKFIGLFLFIGFWVKFNYNIIYNQNSFPEYINLRTGVLTDTISSFDYSFLKIFFISASIFLLSVSLASRFVFNFNSISKKFYSLTLISIPKFIFSSNIILLSLISLFFIFIIFNYKYHFYLRGIIPLIDNIFIIGLYKIYFSYICLFFFALTLDFYIKKKAFFFTIFIMLFFIFFNQFLHLSRLAPVLIIPIFFSLLNYISSNEIKIFNNKKILYILFLSFFLSILSLYLVTIIRNFYFPTNEINLSDQIDLERGNNLFVAFLIERWVGADGLMTIISNKKNLGFDYFFSNSSFSFSNGRLISVYIIGPAAFFFKSGSYIILFLSTFFLLSLIFNIENLVKKLTKNMYFFQYFFGFILAYEFIHIGGGSLRSILYYISLFSFIAFLFALSFFLKKIR
jgi:hypothetical protein